MKKILIHMGIIIAILIILVIFFYPKSCGFWGTEANGVNKDCNCLGFKTGSLSFFSSKTDRDVYWCYGVCTTECKCTRNVLIGTNITLEEISCAGK